MKKKPVPPACRGTIAVPSEMKTEFRKLCIVQDLKPSDVMKKILGSWIEKEKKKVNGPMVVNG